MGLCITAEPLYCNKNSVASNYSHEKTIKGAILMQETNIKVVDALMGKGKTSWAIQYMNDSSKEERFIYITPYLDEVERIKSGVKSRRMVSPQNKQGNWTKKQDLKKLISNEKDIVATHALFKKVDDEIIDLIRMGNYTLILDEVMDVLEEKEVSPADYETLFEKHMTYDEETMVCSWIDEDYKGRFDDYKRMANSGNLLRYGNGLLYWTFPVSAFQAFNNIYILTYLFEGQIQRYYYEMNNVQYTKVGVEQVNGSYELVPYSGTSKEDRERLKSLIQIHESAWNDIGRSKGGSNPLSSSHLEALKENGNTAISKIGNTTLRYYRETTKAHSVGAEAVMWTCVKRFIPDLGKNGYKKQYVAVNARASNQWQDKFICMYLTNLFMRPPVVQLFHKHGVTVNQEQYALSELLQWLFRSRIRNGQPIELFIPSDRMRRILKGYLS